MRRTSPKPLTFALLATWVYVLAVCPSGARGQSIPVWEIESEPLLILGRFEDGPDHALSNIQTAFVQEDGGIVVQNSMGGLFELRFYDGDGRLSATASRYGNGPFEFQRAAAIEILPGDSIWVLGPDGRFALFGPSGEPVREGRLDSGITLPIDDAVAFGSERFVTLRYSGDPRPAPGLRREEFGLKLVENDVERPLTTLRGGVNFFESNGDAFFVYALPYAPQGYAVWGGGRLYLGDSASPIIRVYDPEVGELRSFALERRPVEVTREQQRRMRAAFASLYSGDRGRRWARYARSMEVPDVEPLYGLIVADRTGHLWVQDYEDPWQSGPQDWKVYDEGGNLIADVSLPEGAVPPCSRRIIYRCGSGQGILDITADRIVIETQDEIGTPEVRVFRLRR